MNTYFQGRASDYAPREISLHLQGPLSHGPAQGVSGKGWKRRRNLKRETRMRLARCSFIHDEIVGDVDDVRFLSSTDGAKTFVDYARAMA